jgi:hypothetical protein
MHMIDAHEGQVSPEQIQAVRCRRSCYTGCFEKEWWGLMLLTEMDRCLTEYKESGDFACLVNLAEYQAQESLWQFSLRKRIGKEIAWAMRRYRERYELFWGA